MVTSRLACIPVFAALFFVSMPRARAMAPQGDAAVLPGYRLLHNGESAAALDVFDRLLAASPNSLPAQFGRLQALSERAREDPALQTEFEKRIDAFLSAAEQRWDASTSDSEALFYLANGHMLRAAYRLNHDKGTWGAARDGARAKRLSEQYVKRHPEHGDAYFALGTYNYYVEIAPAFVKVIRTFLFLPSGNRPEGLKQLERAFTQGHLLAPQAGLILMEIYSAFEGRPQEAVRIGERLATQYPDNHRIQFSLAEVYESASLENYEKAAEHYQAVIKREDRRASGPPRDARFRARLGLAAARFAQWRVDETRSVLDEVIDQNPPTPDWVMPNFLLRRANYRALTGDARADEDVKRVLAQPGWKNWHKAATDRLQWADRRRSSGEAEVYAALIPGNRLMAERRWADAAAAYAEVNRRYPDHALVRHRLAVLRFRRGDAEGAWPELHALTEVAGAPDWLKASALLYVGRAHDLAGRRREAVKTYERIIDRYERESAAAAARVGLITPYRRPAG